jgi:alpha-galactosidase
MVDFGSAAHADYFSITDAYDPLSNRRAFYDASHVLPAAMLECYVEKWPTPNIESFRYMLRSGMQGWLTIMLNTNDWSDEQHAAAKQEFQLYKTKLRPLIRDANIYHIAPRPDGLHWDGTEFFDKRSGRGVVFAFRGSIDNQSQYSFKLRGMDSHKRYSLHFQDKSAPDRVITGTELMQAGLRVQLRLPDSSELVFVGEAK